MYHAHLADGVTDITTLSKQLICITHTLKKCGHSPPIPVSYTHLDVYKRQSLYYAKLKTADTSSGYFATELGTVSAIDDKYIKMGFLDAADKGSEADVYKRQMQMRLRLTEQVIQNLH